jgi:hypothetical protein
MSSIKTHSVSESWMKPILTKFLDIARRAEWSVELRPKGELALAEPFRSRFPSLPGELVAFLEAVKSCVDRQRVTWFLCEEHYNGSSAWPIRWNEWELHSDEVAAGKAALRERMNAFWSVNLPVVGTVRHEYAYLTLRVSGPDRGAVYHGCDPEVEEVERVCSSFDDLLEIVCAKIAEPESGPAWTERFFSAPDGALLHRS